MQVSAWFDASLFFDLVTGHSAMGYMLTANQTFFLLVAGFKKNSNKTPRPCWIVILSVGQGWW